MQEEEEEEAEEEIDEEGDTPADETIAYNSTDDPELNPPEKHEDVEDYEFSYDEDIEPDKP